MRIPRFRASVSVRRDVLAVVCTALAVFVFGAGQASAASQHEEACGSLGSPPLCAGDVGSNGAATAVALSQVEPAGEPAPPTVVTGEAAGVTTGRATLTGSVNPNGDATEYYFEYGETTSYGSSTPVQDIPAGEAPVGVAEPLSGLTPGKTYHFRLVASSAAGGPIDGADQKLATQPQTPPTVYTGGVAGETPTEATLTGAVVPNGAATKYHFEYGETESFGSNTPVAETPSEEGNFGVSTTITGLTPGKTYYYQLVASNAKGGPIGGGISSFVMLEAPLTQTAEVEGTALIFNGELSPHGSQGSVTYQFDYNTGASCTGGESTPATYSGEGKEAHVEAEVVGLEPDTRYTFCLVASNGYGARLQGNEISAQTGKFVAPRILGESYSAVGSASASLEARLNPGGVQTEYHFEYGTSGPSGSDTPVTNLSATDETLPVSVQLDGLAPGTEYHFRVVAVNADGETTTGRALTFRTMSPGVVGLPDGRVYERVSPAEDLNANVYVPSSLKFGIALSEGIFTELPFRAAADGDAVAYMGEATTTGRGLTGPGLGNSFLATRAAGGGWTQTGIQPSGYFRGEYEGYSSDLSVGYLTAPSELGFEIGLPPLSPEAPGGGYQVLYAHENSDGAYRPAFTKAVTLHEPYGDFGVGFTGDVNGTIAGPLYAGSSADNSAILFEANDALVAPAAYGGQYLNNLYISVDGQVSLVNVLPDGSTEASATFGAAVTASGGTAGEEARKKECELSHVISADGSRIFWTDMNTGDLYMRENPTSSNARTVQVDAAVGGGGRFWTATEDGSKVFFTKGDLYVYDVESGQTTDLTPGVEVRGVLGASENGEYVYYVNSSDVLSLWHDGLSTRIATLSGEDGVNVEPFQIDSGDYQPGDWVPGLGHRTAEVTPSGGSVVFMSNQVQRTANFPSGYQNGGMEEVYVYEAESGQLFCASCDPSGEPPQSNQQTGGVAGAAAYLPVSWRPTYQPRLISDDGNRVFFDSAEALVPQDTNGKQDVYEWERDGTGSCREASGCIYLLSGGTGGSASWLLDASTSGNDVFIISRTQLVPGDPYDSFAVFDVRVGGLQTLASPACSGTGCQGVPPAPPYFAAPTSATFSGAGNVAAATGPAVTKKPQPKSKPKKRARTRKLGVALKACRRRHGRKRAVCEARARKRHGTGSSAQKSSRGRS
jgi:hypothetical protein